MPHSSWIDVSVPLRHGMVQWPGDPAAHITRFADMEKGAVCNVSQLNMCAHVGTHMDGLLHFIHRGAGLDTMPIEATVGPARVIQIRDRESVKPAELARHKPRKGERLILKTTNSRQFWRDLPFNKDFVHIRKDAAQYLADCRIRSIGIDYLSVGGFERDGVETHRILLGAGIWIIEGLDLRRIKPGRYDLMCLPVKIENSDGAPARAFLRPR